MLLACGTTRSMRVASVPAASPNARCPTCHEAEASEWNASLHRAAFTDRDFQASFTVEPDRFCFECHAPLARDRGDLANIALGVACISCHRASPEHGEGGGVVETRECGGCHEFSFPRRAAAMQSTVSEHARSEQAARTCASCHLPERGGHRDHRFAVSRNISLLRASLSMVARRTADGLAITLTTHDVGHAMPTGDLFRRLVVKVEGEAADGSFAGEEEIVLARRFERVKGLPLQVEDDRVVGTKQVAVSEPWIGRAPRVKVAVHYERVAETVDVRDVRGRKDHRGTLFASVVLAEAVLEGW